MESFQLQAYKEALLTSHVCALVDTQYITIGSDRQCIFLAD